MGSEQMSVDTTKGNKHCRRADLRRTTLKGNYFLTVMFGNTLVKLSVLGSANTAKREHVLIVRMASLLKILNVFLFILSFKKVENTYVLSIMLPCVLPLPLAPPHTQHFEDQMAFVNN